MVYVLRHDLPMNLQCLSVVCTKSICTSASDEKVGERKGASNLFRGPLVLHSNTLSRPVVKHKVQINTGRSSQATVLLEVREGVQPKSQENRRLIKCAEIRCKGGMTAAKC